MAGRLTLICGCLYSGKTTSLIRHLRDALARGENVVCFKNQPPIGVIRSNEGATFPAVQVTHAGEIPELLYSGTTLVGVCDGHLFDLTLATVCETLVAEGVDVIITGWWTDTNGEPVPVMTRLWGMASVISMLTAKCTFPGCTAMANRTISLEDGTNVPRCEKHLTPITLLVPEEV